jgi:LysM repeat protein
MNKILLILFSAFFFLESSAQMTPQEYVNEYKEMAIREMKRMGVPAAITLAQGLLETQNGNSDLVKKSNNHFGIKCKSSWTAESVTHDDDAEGECFRMYKNAEESYRDHSNFLRANDRYSFLFKLDPADYKAWAYGLRKAGYATNPKYPEILIKYIEENNLEQYTDIALNEVPHFDGSKYKDDEEPVITLVSNEETFEPTNVTINGLKALFVPKGTSLLAIASEKKINLSKLLEMNDLKKDGLLEKDQFVFLEKKAKEGNREFCKAEPGETLYDIAQKNGVVLESLLAYNNFPENEQLKAGTTVYLKPPVIAILDKEKVLPVQNISSEPENNNQRTVSNIHEVLPKEGLYSISKKYGVSVQQLREWNNLQSDNIQIGQQLIISK